MTETRQNRIIDIESSIDARIFNELPRRKQRGIKETTDDRPKGRGIEPSPASGEIKIISNFNEKVKDFFYAFG
jgi:hypothetical protein